MVRSIFFLIIVLSGVITFSSCAKKIVFPSSPVVPAAEGRVKIKQDGNNNYVVEVSLKHLAPSRSLQPPKEYYVVWIETENNGIKNIGQISSSSGLLSSTLKASLSTVTSFKPRVVFITAEDSGNASYPGGFTVLRTEPFNVK